MHNQRHPFLLVLILLSIGIRSVLGAPCCMTPIGDAVSEAVAFEDHGEHAGYSGHDAHHAHSEEGGHSGHAGHGSDDPGANPCCSACGPTLPAQAICLNRAAAANPLPQPAPIRELETRPPFPAYEARGPPLLI